MGHYRAKDALLVPGLLSLVRVPLALAFPFAVSRPWLAFVVLLLAGGSDVLDGWIARKFDQATPTGAALDPITDKIFVTSVVFTLFAHGWLSLLGVVLLSIREIGELPLVMWFAVSRSARKNRASEAKANIPGKLATVLQFVTVAIAVLHGTFREVALIVTAIAGGLAAISYW
ncbi:MAG: CDP-alcohol phosphatidyltransferase family protein, partial [Polyangiaceae bacterium]